MPARSVKMGQANMGRLAGVTNVMRSIVEEGSSILPRPHKCEPHINGTGFK